MHIFCLFLLMMHTEATIFIIAVTGRILIVMIYILFAYKQDYKQINANRKPERKGTHFFKGFYYQNNKLIINNLISEYQIKLSAEMPSNFYVLLH